jgi:imidazolonepropionase-like amidohydrolase
MSEHGNLLDAATAALMAERGAFLVPTLVTYDAMERRGAELGLAREARLVLLSWRSLTLTQRQPFMLAA